MSQGEVKHPETDGRLKENRDDNSRQGQQSRKQGGNRNRGRR